MTGNCGFSIAPVKAADRDFITQIFARVEDMAPGSLAAIPWSFESFPEFMASREGQLGINAAFYVGHCNLRRWVMGDDCTEREATEAEIEAMRTLVPRRCRPAPRASLDPRPDPPGRGGSSPSRAGWRRTRSSTRS